MPPIMVSTFFVNLNMIDLPIGSSSFDSSLAVEILVKLLYSNVTETSQPPTNITGQYRPQPLSLFHMVWRKEGSHLGPWTTWRPPEPLTTWPTTITWPYLPPDHGPPDPPDPPLPRPCTTTTWHPDLTLHSPPQTEWQTPVKHFIHSYYVHGR